MSDDPWAVIGAIIFTIFFGWGVKSCAETVKHTTDTGYCEKTCVNRRSRAAEEFCFCMNDQGKWQYDSVTGEKK